MRFLLGLFSLSLFAGVVTTAVASTGFIGAEGLQEESRSEPNSESERSELPNPNDLCAAANVVELSVAEGIKKVPANADYCELPSSELPAEVATLLSHLGGIHNRYAAMVGEKSENLFGFGVRIQILPHPAGPIESTATREQDGYDYVLLHVFKDFGTENFPDRIYAHELTHWLLIQGKLGPAARELEPNYLFTESFPDLMAAAVTDSLKMDYPEPSVREPLRFVRDGTPVYSMTRPLKDFYLGVFQKMPLNECAKVKPAALSANEKSLCRYYRNDARNKPTKFQIFADAKEKPPLARELAAPFNPDRCLVHYYNGTVALDACFKAAYGPVLISFFQTIRPLLGDQPIIRLMDAINLSGSDPDHYTCEFTSAAAQQRVSVPSMVPFGNFVRVFTTLRETLGGEAQAAFDTAWASHGLDHWVKLQQLDQETVVRPYAYEVLLQTNSDFATQFKCDSPIVGRRGTECGVVCKHIPATRFRLTPIESPSP